MEKPKVFVFITAYRPFIGGAEIAIQEITRRLKDRFDFYIVTSRFDRRLPRREVLPEGIVLRVGFGTRFDKYLLPFWQFTWTRRVQVDLDTPCPSAIVGVDLSHASVSAAIYKLFHPGAPFIFNIQFGESEERLRSGRAGMISLMFRFILSRADYVTAISSYLLDLARKYGYGGPGEVIHNGVDVRKFEIRNSKSETNSKLKIKNSKTIITTSRLVPKNGIDILVRAMAEIKKRMPDIECWILGDGPERQKLELLTTNYSLQTNIKFLGEIPYEKIPEYLHRADIFVRPSRSEGMGNSFVEALAAGLPVIGTPVGGIPDIIEDGKTGLFVRSEAPSDLAEKIIFLLNNPQKGREIVERGSKMVRERFSWDEIASAYIRIFEGVCVNLRVLIAAPLFPPQLGGPALYAKHLGEEFTNCGHRVSTVSFGQFLFYPSGIRHLLYFFKLMNRALKSDLIFALDYTSIGFPAALASALLRKPLVIRVEGDFLWESFVESRRQDLTLQQFYLKTPPLSWKEKIIHKVSGWVFRRASVLVFSSEWRRRMIVEGYHLSAKKTAIIRNVFPPFSKTYPENWKLKIENSHTVLWAGRMLYLKNLRRLVSAFQKVNDGSWELHLVGEGTERPFLEKSDAFLLKGVTFFPSMSREKLLEKMAESALFILPSLSEVGPNIVAEALAIGMPVVMTKETGYKEEFGKKVEFVDPLSEDDLRQKLERIMKGSADRVTPPFEPRSWEVAAGDWLNLFCSL